MSDQMTRIRLFDPDGAQIGEVAVRGFLIRAQIRQISQAVTRILRGCDNPGGNGRHCHDARCPVHHADIYGDVADG